MIQFLRKNFLAGLFVLIPMIVSGWILLSMLEIVWGMKNWIPDAWIPSLFLSPGYGFLFNVAFTVIASVALLALISLVGLSSRFYFGQKMIGVFSDLLNRIPILRSVHGALEQLISAVSKGGGGGQFSRVVLIEFPQPGIWSLAFVTGESKILPSSETMINVFIPMTPNPTSGYFLVVPEKSVRDAHMTVEHAFKTLLSLGIAQ